jgi:hypothetical protein
MNYSNVETTDNVIELTGRFPNTSIEFFEPKDMGVKYFMLHNKKNGTCSITHYPNYWLYHKTSYWWEGGNMNTYYTSHFPQVCHELGIHWNKESL